MADDYPAWCSKVRGILQRAGWEIIDEAWDGPEGVRKVSQLQPDIVIRYRLARLKAAKLIREKVVRTKVVFLSQETENDVIRAAYAASGVRSCVEGNSRQGFSISNRNGSSIRTQSPFLLDCQIEP